MILDKEIINGELKASSWLLFGCNGWSLNENWNHDTKNVLDTNPQQKTIIVSGFSKSDRVRAAKDLGAGAYVRKPYIKEKLGLAVRKELDQDFKKGGNG